MKDLSSLGRRDDLLRFWKDREGVCEADDLRDADCPSEWVRVSEGRRGKGRFGLWLGVPRAKLSGVKGEGGEKGVGERGRGIWAGDVMSY